MSSQVSGVTYPSISPVKPQVLCLGKLKEASECCRILNEEKAFEDSLLWQKCSLNVVEVYYYSFGIYVYTSLPPTTSSISSPFLKQVRLFVQYIVSGVVKHLLLYLP